MAVVWYGQVGEISLMGSSGWGSAQQQPLDHGTPGGPQGLGGQAPLALPHWPGGGCRGLAGPQPQWAPVPSPGAGRAIAPVLLAVSGDRAWQHRVLFTARGWYAC